MSVRVTIEADWYSGAICFEANDTHVTPAGASLSERIRICAAQAEASAIAAVTARSQEDPA